MKKTTFIIAAFVALFITSNAAQSQNSGPVAVAAKGQVLRAADYNRPIRVACVGDSITQGAGAGDTSKFSYPALLAQFLGGEFEVRNFGVSGSTLLKKGDRPYWKEAAFTQSSEFAPDAVIIMLGTNDSKPINWQHKDEFAADAQALIAHYKNLPSKPKVWLALPAPVIGAGALGITQPVVHDEVIPIERQVAEATGTPIIDINTALSPFPELIGDTVHPNQAGYALIARTMFQSLTGALPREPAFKTPLTIENFDPAALKQWFDGAEQPWTGELWAGLWTQSTGTNHDGIKYGDSKTPGARHLRFGFKTPVSVGSILVRGGGKVSILKPDAAYPGDMNDETQWIPAQRLKDGKISSDEVTGLDEIGLWNLPSVTATRAVRFSHTNAPSDPSFAMVMGGATLLTERIVNIASQARVLTSQEENNAPLLTDNQSNWVAWANGPQGSAQIVSATNPEWITLVWPKPVALNGMAALWSGIGSAQAQIYTGPEERNPRDAPDADWKTIKTTSGMKAGHMAQFYPNWIDFGAMITTRVLRLRIIAPVKENESHPHVQDQIKGGKRVWLGELLALQALGNADLKTAVSPVAIAAETTHAPIPIRFNLPEAGNVTLVVEGMSGKRVRNLVADTYFPAGANVVWWDGMDDLGRDLEAARHGLYHVPGTFVVPGAYKVRGLVHKKIGLNYEFSVFNAGTPPWETRDKSGGWLANHAPPQSALYVPDGGPNKEPVILIGANGTEGGTGLAWLDLNGRKIYGVGWVGTGAWTSAPYLARDVGDKPVPGTYAYAAAPWDELRLTALTTDRARYNNGEKPVLKPYWKTPSVPKNYYGDPNGQMGGIAAYNGVLAISLAHMKILLFVDAAENKVLGTAPLDDGRGVAFDTQGRLFVLSGKTLLRYPLSVEAIRTAAAQSTPPADALLMGAKLTLPAPQTLIKAGLEEPRGIALDSKGNIYISDWGNSHQVKVFDASGKLVRAIGTAGSPKVGVYDELHMNYPQGLTIDSNNHLWVSEFDFQPKRVSQWRLDGKLVKAFYGPADYGGGGQLDSKDNSSFNYNGMEFKVDWKTGKDRLNNVFFRRGADAGTLPPGGAPETALYVGGRQYMTNCYNSNPTNGVGIATIWQMKNGMAQPVAAMGRANSWELLKTEAFRSSWPNAGDATIEQFWGGRAEQQRFFVWSDTNGDARPQPAEIKMQAGNSDGVTIMPDLSFVFAVVNDKAMRFKPSKFTVAGAPVYDLAAGEVLVTGAQGRASTGGGQALVSPDGWTILTNAPQPFSNYGIGGVKNGVPLWSYPSMWPGLHAAHEAPTPGHPGMLIGTTRLLGGIVTPGKGEAGPLWAINGNFGNMYLFTSDGLFISQLFQDVRQAPLWQMPVATRGMEVGDLSLHDETFWPSITQSPAGEIYVSGNLPNVVRVAGLDTVRRIVPIEVRLTAGDLKKAQQYMLEQEALRQKESGIGMLQVALKNEAPTVDGNVAEWNDAKWVTIDKSGVAANFDSDSRPYNTTAAIAVAGDRLYAAYRTVETNLLNNSGELAIAPFKTGGALDLMIGSIEGGARLLVTQAKGKTLAVLYRPKVPGTTTDPVPFSSPWRTIKFDRVDDVSDQIQLASDGKGNYEMSAPLSLLNLKPQDGQSIKGDIGVLRGNGAQTVQRVYWSNKATGITADVPSEAELTPQLWGEWQFKKRP